MARYINRDNFIQNLETDKFGFTDIVKIGIALDKARIDDIGEFSDGYHTFNELYHHRAVLFSVICNMMPEKAWKAKLHDTGDMFDGMFIVGIETEQGQATYHYNIDPYWDLFKVKELEKAPKWDGHTAKQAIARIGSINRTQKEIHGGKHIMKIKLDKGAYMPTRAHATDAGLDVYAMQTQIVPAKESAKFDTGVHIELPQGTVGMLKSKSGLNVNHGITSEGVIDVGYTGSIVVKLYNNSGYDYKVNAGDKISQLVIMPIITPELELVEELESTERGTGGFGSTGR